MSDLPNALALQRNALWERLGLASLIMPALLLIVITMLLPVCWRTLKTQDPALICWPPPWPPPFTRATVH